MAYYILCKTHKDISYETGFCNIPEAIVIPARILVLDVLTNHLGLSKWQDKFFTDPAELHLAVMKLGLIDH